MRFTAFVDRNKCFHYLIGLILLLNNQLDFEFSYTNEVVNMSKQEISSIYETAFDGVRVDPELSPKLVGTWISDSVWV